MSVTTIPVLEDLQGPWANFAVKLTGPTAGTDTLTLREVYPFMSVTDLKRQIWIQMNGDPRWAPTRVFLGVQSAGGIRPIEFYWPTSVSPTVDVPDPRTMKTPSPALVDEAGNRRPVGPTMIGSMVLETALSPEMMQDGGSIPVVEAISLAALTTDLTPEELTSALYGGYYQFYFPWLTAPAEVLDAASTAMTQPLRDSYSAIVPYMDDRLGRIGIVQKALKKHSAGETFSMQTMVRLNWTLPPPQSKPESLEKTFYGLQANATIPFMRFFAAGGKTTPLLKLGLEPDGTPIVHDPKIFTQYIHQPAPATNSAVILARIPIQSPHVERGSAFTLYMFEDGNSDITLEVPQRGMTYIAAVAADAQRVLQEVMQAIGFPPTATPTLRDIHATYKWSHPDPRHAAPLSTARLQSRVAALTPFLDTIPLLPEEKATAVFQWRAVSNYESESAQFAYITQMILRGQGPEEEIGAQALQQYIGNLQKKFGMTTAAAQATLERWMERRAEAVAPATGPTAGSLAVAKHSTGASIAVYGAHPEYAVEIQNVNSYEELQRILSVVGVLLGASNADLTLQPPTLQQEAVTAAVEIQETIVAENAVKEGGPPPSEEVELAEMDPAMAALMADLGFGMNMGGEDEEQTTGFEDAELAGPPPQILPEALDTTLAAAPPTTAMPDIDAVVATVEEECRGTPWAPGEPALKISPDYYMAKLKTLDKEMFGYSASKTGRTKTYSKSCQRRDERQPNIMTLAEYARVKRCYEDRVRFVNLPPSKPEDLPPIDPAYKIPAYKPPKKGKKDKYKDNLFDNYDETNFLIDPVTKKPIWTVYGYENKTRPGEFLYLMCSEFWCERDNLPLLRSEVEGTEGRGFTKKPNTCPFCGGKVIENLEAPRPGESVIQRLPKEATGKLHQFIGIIQRNKHPKGWSLPCCDTSTRLLQKYMVKAYRGKLIYGQELTGDDDDDEEEGGVAAAAAPTVEDDFAEPPPELIAEMTTTTTGVQPAGMVGVAEEEGRKIDYEDILENLQTKYILGSDKALDNGKIGLLPPAIDAFFGQNGPRSLESRGIRPTFIDGAVVFIRVGVDTRIRQPGLNLFAGLAPFLHKQNAEQVQQHFMTQRTLVRAFESANYGTLVQEFAARSTLADSEIQKALQIWASEMGYPLGSARPHVTRLYKAWRAYLAYLKSPTEPKQLRHVEHVLAQPGVITPRGLLLITLEQEGDAVKVVCPSFGIPPSSVFEDVPVAFILHDKRDESWEPIVLYNNSRSAILTFGERTPELETMPKDLRASLMKWLRDWRTSSLGCGRPSPPPHVWTPDRDTTMLPRLTPLRQKIQNYVPSTLVRDRSNRLAGVLFTAGTASVFVPCLDDGALADQLPRIYEVDMIPPATVDTYMRFYTAPDGVVSQWPSLRPVKLLARITDAASMIVGFMTEIGTMIPTAPQPVGSAGLPNLPVQQVDQFPWERDALILRSPDVSASAAVALEETTASVEEQLTEAYQHLRLSLSRWLTRDAKGPTFRKNMIAVMKAKVPLYERRKRMDILLEPKVRDWIATEQTEERKSMSLLREDCLSLPEGTCATTGACRWSGGRCLIHAPVRDATKTDPVRIFTARLSDEILRYAASRQEILDNKVVTIRTPRGIVRVGDELYMAIKQKESATDIMERLGFGEVAAMAFPEEMVQFAGMEEEMGAVADETVLPSSFLEKGYQLPKIMEGLEDPRGLAFAAATNRSLEDWEDLIKKGRTKIADLQGDPNRPLQWSHQDFYVLSYITSAGILWVRQQANGSIAIEKWIQAPPAVKLAQPLYILLWGPNELTLTRGKSYRFMAKELPADVLTAMDASSPMAEEEAKGMVVPEPVPVQEPTVGSEESTISELPPPSVTVAEPPVAVAEPPVAVAEPPVTVAEPPVTVAGPSVAEPEEEEEIEETGERVTPPAKTDLGQLPPPQVAPTIEGNVGQLPPPQPAPSMEAPATIRNATEVPEPPEPVTELPIAVAEPSTVSETPIAVAEPIVEDQTSSIEPMVAEPTVAVAEPTVAVAEPTVAVAEPTVAVAEPTVAEPTPKSNALNFSVDMEELGDEDIPLEG